MLTHTTLGSYRIVGKLGEGGMGEVYRARDSKLNRDVAIKVLPAAFALDADRLSRFTREAQTLASLNHQNIATIYGIEESDGVRALVMELVDGEDLSQRIARGAIPVDEALPIARQIADALDAAHEAGIVHRDLKPANVKVRPDGAVKVLDFGLAKAFEPGATGSNPAVGTIANSPTFTSPAMTAMGVILGTAAYMSPEQARGSRVDTRADIWAFGVVLFEMLSGRRLFAGETVTDTLAEVLKGQIDWSALPGDAPPAVRRLLARCLERDPRRRLRDIGDARQDIEEALTNPRADLPAARPVAGARHSTVRWVAACMACLAIGATAMFLIRPPTSHVSPLPLRFVVTPPPATAGHVIQNVRISHDGRRIVYADAASPVLLVRDFDEFESRPLAGTEGGSRPFFAPDGESVGFYADGRVKRVSVSGGDPVTVCENPTESPGADWGPDGTIILSRTWTSGLWKVPAGGGTAVQVTTPDRAKGESGHFWPRFLPDGHHVLFTAFGGKGLPDARVGIVDLQTSQVQMLFPGSLAVYVASGQIVYFHLGGYHAVPFDLATLTVTGTARPVLEDVRPLDPLGSAENYLDVARSGRLVFVPGRAPRSAPYSHLVWIDRHGRVERLPFADTLGGFALSPDQRHVAVTRFAAGDMQVWIYDLERGTRDQLTRDGANFDPTWNPAGDQVAFTSVIKGSFDLRSAPSDGSRPPEVILATDQDELIWDWLPDGRSGVFGVIGPDGGKDLQVMKVGHPASRHVLVATPLDEDDPAVSPDGRWIAWSAAATVYVARFPGMTNRVQVAVGASAPRWAHRSRELFFERNHQLHVISWHEGPAGFTMGQPTALFTIPRGPNDLRYSVSADDSRILMLESDPAREAAEEIRVVDDGFGVVARPADARPGP